MQTLARFLHANVLRRTLVLAAAVAFFGAGALHAHAYSCAMSSEAAALREADVVFEGIALPSSVPAGLPQGPSRFRVAKYLKGSGPEIVTVSHSFYPNAGVHHRAGDRMVVYAHRDGDRLVTSECSGTYRVGDPKPFYEPQRAASFTWRFALGALALPAGTIILMRRRGPRLGATAPRILDYGDAEEDAMAVRPGVLERLAASNEAFTLIDEDDVESPDDKPWPLVSGDRVIWAVGERESDITPIAIVAAHHAGDTTFLVQLTEWNHTHLPDELDPLEKR